MINTIKYLSLFLTRFKILIKIMLVFQIKLIHKFTYEKVVSTLSNNKNKTSLFQIKYKLNIIKYKIKIKIIRLKLFRVHKTLT